MLYVVSWVFSVFCHPSLVITLLPANNVNLNCELNIDLSHAMIIMPFFWNILYFIISHSKNFSSSFYAHMPHNVDSIIYESNLDDTWYSCKAEEIVKINKINLDRRSIAFLSFIYIFSETEVAYYLGSVFSERSKENSNL